MNCFVNNLNHRKNISLNGSDDSFFGNGFLLTTFKNIEELITEVYNLNKDESGLFSINYDQGNTFRESMSSSDMNNFNVKAYNIINDFKAGSSCFQHWQEEDIFLELLNGYYEIKNWVEVKRFIDGDEEFVNFLVDAAKEIESIFGKKVSISLIKEEDPEFKDEGFLVAYISSSELDFKDMLNKLDTFEKEWYFDNINNEKEGFDIDVR